MHSIFQNEVKNVFIFNITARNKITGTCSLKNSLLRDFGKNLHIFAKIKGCQSAIIDRDIVWPDVFV